MIFNQQQSTHWNNMISSIENFYNGKIQYTTLVYGLEGDLDTGEFENKSIIDQWYDHWTPLEILSSTKGDDVTINDVDKYLSVFDKFLREISRDFDVHAE